VRILLPAGLISLPPALLAIDLAKVASFNSSCAYNVSVNGYTLPERWQFVSSTRRAVERVRRAVAQESRSATALLAIDGVALAQT